MVKLVTVCHNACKPLNRTLTTLDQLEADDTYVEPLVPTTEDAAEDTKLLSGDTGTLFMIRRAFLSPHNSPDYWLHNSVFQSTCTINGKVCSFFIDSGSCENVISESAITKLGLSTEAHPHHYKLAWRSWCALITMSIGSTYSDEISCDVVPMEVCHLLLGRP